MSKQCLVGLVGWGIFFLLFASVKVVGWIPVILMAVLFISLFTRFAMWHRDREHAYWDRVFEDHREQQEKKRLQKEKESRSARRSFQDSGPPESVCKWN
jgi:anaerobic C4-dicarboxylate transporter